MITVLQLAPASPRRGSTTLTASLPTGFASQRSPCNLSVDAQSSGWLFPSDRRGLVNLLRETSPAVKNGVEQTLTDPEQALWSEGLGIFLLVGSYS